jgi:hypothetical protein
VLTNDLLYESKDSREILKGSFSSRTLRLLDCPDLLDHVDQKLLFSVGDGYFLSAHLFVEVAPQ